MDRTVCTWSRILTRSSGAVIVLPIAPAKAPAKNSTAGRGTRARAASGLRRSSSPSWGAARGGEGRRLSPAAASSYTANGRDRWAAAEVAEAVKTRVAAVLKWPVPGLSDGRRPTGLDRRCMDSATCEFSDVGGPFREDNVLTCLSDHRPSPDGELASVEGDSSLTAGRLLSLTVRNVTAPLPNRSATISGSLTAPPRIVKHWSSNLVRVWNCNVESRRTPLLLFTSPIPDKLASSPRVSGCGFPSDPFWNHAGAVRCGELIASDTGSTK